MRNYYCNVNAPPTFDGHILSYVDLDIDVLVDPDFSFEILDLDDFDQNAKRYAYPSEIQRNARQAVTDLVDLIESRSFPFDQ